MATLSGETAKASAFPISRFLLSKVDFPLRVHLSLIALAKVQNWSSLLRSPRNRYSRPGNP